VRRLLEWQPRLLDVLGLVDSPGGSGYRAVDVSWSLPNVIPLTAGRRWSDLVTDPRRGLARHDPIDPETRARALATLLTGAELGRPGVDVDELAAIATELAVVAQSPTAAALLLAQLGPARLAELVDDVAPNGRNVAWGRPRLVAAARAPVLEGLGAVLGAGWRAAGGRRGQQCRAMLAGLPIRALGSVLAAATRRVPGRIPTTELVRAALAALTESSARPSDEDAAVLSDGILAALATDGAAARAVLELLPAEALADLLVRPRRDPQLLAGMLLASNDPASVDATAVAASMRRVLDVLHSHRNRLGSGSATATYADMPPHLGVYVGRWAEPLASGLGRSTAWTVERVGWLAARPEIAAELLVTLDARYRVRVHQAASGGDLDRIGPIAYGHAAIADLVAHAELGEALADEAAWDRAVNGVQFAVDAASVLLAPVAPPFGAALQGAALASGAAEASGASPASWLLSRFADGPAAARDLLARQAADRDVADVELEHVAISAVLHGQRDRLGGLRLPALPVRPARPSDPPRPEDAANLVGRRYHAQVDAWVDELTVSADPRARQVARQIAAASTDVRTAALEARNHVAA
jgi:hypothetical protein